jgi:hypothetical protein
MDVDRLLRSLYERFNARDVDAVLAATADGIDWPNAWEGGRLRGKDAVREYWLRQWAQISPHVEPLTVTPRPDGRVAVDVRQVVRTLNGDLLDDQRVTHVYEMRDGLVVRMTVEDAQ